MKEAWDFEAVVITVIVTLYMKCDATKNRLTLTKILTHQIYGELERRGENVPSGRTREEP